MLLPKIFVHIHYLRLLDGRDTLSSRGVLNGRTRTEEVDIPVCYEFISNGSDANACLETGFHSLSSTLATLGQNFFSRSHGSGYAAFSRLYGRSQSPRPSPDTTSTIGCGAILRTLPSRG
jgi:hypothetical protein